MVAHLKRISFERVIDGMCDYKHLLGPHGQNAVRVWQYSSGHGCGQLPTSSWPIHFLVRMNTILGLRWNLQIFKRSTNHFLDLPMVPQYTQCLHPSAPRIKSHGNQFFRRTSCVEADSFCWRAQGAAGEGCTGWGDETQQSIPENCALIFFVACNPSMRDHEGSEWSNIKHVMILGSCWAAREQNLKP